MTRCESLLAAGETELIIHALGAAIPRALNLANVLENKLPQVKIKCCFIKWFFFTFLSFNYF